MENIKYHVRQFKKENKMAFPTWHKLVHIAKINDWKLTPYSKAKKLIQEHKLEKRITNHRAFSYEFAGEIIILYRDSLKGYNRLYTICHEIGHIYLGHTSKSDKNEKEEMAADEFAGLLMNGYRKLLIFTNILALTSIITVATLNLKSNNSNEFSLPMQETEIVTEMITDEPVSDIPETSAEEITELEEDDKLYYVTPSGEKYHLEDCPHINPDNCITITKEEAEKMGYKPCKDCNPDKKK